MNKSPGKPSFNSPRSRNHLLLLLCLASASGLSAHAGIRGWYELGATSIEDAYDAKKFGVKPLSGMKMSKQR